ncbi:DUF3598 family protein [Oscillatoriales cyanobacterium LEGE 11467]|uniref:DUF3598 family protein n=1 Tax=Zarconia navalis LEGE 11467 TaxID=1828826 RepID=A0A928VY02_9CYAN|nr:DUF3598 family protein [Zarconia navalis]MBE9040847.1 DUF3598 family protein [Zarconia navalis LEGE 11467]
MNVLDRHWENLFGSCSLDGEAWHSITTTYSANQQQIGSRKFVRSFYPNSDRTSITHINCYHEANGSTRERTWEINKSECNQLDGLIHPAAGSMRALSVGDGVTAWVTPKWVAGRSVSPELFVPHGDRRQSLVIVYSTVGWIDRIFHIREQLGEFPPQPSPPQNIDRSGQWKVTRSQMTPNLQISRETPTEPVELAALLDRDLERTLTDGVVVYTPEKLTQGKAFEIASGQFISEKTYKQVRVNYTDAGVFNLLTTEAFEKI